VSIATDYIVRTKYVVEGNAPEKLRDVEKAASGAGRGVKTLREQFGGLGSLMLGGGLALGAKKFFFDFNNDLEQSRIRMAGMFQLNTGGQFNENMAKSVDLVGRLQERAKSSVGETSDFVGMAANILQPLTKAKATMQEIEDITAGATVAAKSFGYQAEVAALDIQQVLMGTAGTRERFARALIEPMGYTMKQLNAMTETKRLGILKRAFTSPAILSMAKAQGQSFEGQWSTLMDSVKMGLGKVGLPLFKAITAEVSKWNDWISSHPGKIQAFADRVSGLLMEGFHAVKDALMWVDKNRETLMALAKAALIMKGASIVGSLAASPFMALNSLSGSLTTAGDSAKGFGGAMSSVAGRLSQFANIAGLTYAGASFVAGAALRGRDRELAARANIGADVDYAFGRGTGQFRAPGEKGLHSRVEDALASGLLQRKSGGGFGVNQLKLAQGVGRQGEYVAGRNNALLAGAVSMGGKVDLYVKSNRELIAEMELLRMAQQDAANRMLDGIRRPAYDLIAAAVAAQTIAVTEGLTGFQRPGAKTPGTTINVSKVEVAAKDPARWIQELDRETKKRARVPRRPRSALRGEGV
jgi:hypothetical protein